METKQKNTSYARTNELLYILEDQIARYYALLSSKIEEMQAILTPDYPTPADDEASVAKDIPSNYMERLNNIYADIVRIDGRIYNLLDRLDLGVVCMEETNANNEKKASNNPFIALVERIEYKIAFLAKNVDTLVAALSLFVYTAENEKNVVENEMTNKEAISKNGEIIMNISNALYMAMYNLFSSQYDFPEVKPLLESVIYEAVNQEEKTPRAKARI